jgi:hypothetical protein
MKALKITGIVLGSIVILVVIIVGILWILLSWPSKIASHVTPVISDAAAAQQLDATWDTFKNTVLKSAPGTVVSIILTQEEVNSKINEQLKTVDLPQGMSVSDVNVNLKDGKLKLAANVGYSLFKGSAGMEAEITSVNGTPSVVVQDVDFGSLPIPQSLKDQLKKLIPEGGILKVSDLPFNVQDIQIENGQLVMKGVTK